MPPPLPRLLLRRPLSLRLQLPALTVHYECGLPVHLSERHRSHVLCADVRAAGRSRMDRRAAAARRARVRLRQREVRATRRYAVTASTFPVARANRSSRHRQQLPSPIGEGEGTLLLLLLCVSLRCATLYVRASLRSPRALPCASETCEGRADRRGEGREEAPKAPRHSTLCALGVLVLIVVVVVVVVSLALFTSMSQCAARCGLHSLERVNEAPVDEVPTQRVVCRVFCIVFCTVTETETWASRTEQILTRGTKRNAKLRHTAYRIRVVPFRSVPFHTQTQNSHDYLYIISARTDCPPLLDFP